MCVFGRPRCLACCRRPRRKEACSQDEDIKSVFLLVSGRTNTKAHTKNAHTQSRFVTSSENSRATRATRRFRPQVLF